MATLEELTERAYLVALEAADGDARRLVRVDARTWVVLNHAVTGRGRYVAEAAVRGAPYVSTVLDGRRRRP